MHSSGRFGAGLLLAGGGSTLFSGKAIVVKLAYRYGVDAETLIALRMLFALPFFVVVLWWTSRGARPLAGELVKRVGALRLTAYAMCVASVGVCVQFALMRPLGYLAQPAPVIWLSLFNAIACTVVPVFVTMVAIARIGAGTTSLVGMVGPVATIALAYVFLGEPFTGWQLAGTALVLAGIFVLSKKTA